MKTPTLLFLVSSLCLSSFSHSDTWAERQALDKIRSEIASLEALITDAKNRGSRQSRTSFNYELLLSDLKKVQEGISQHLNSPMEPIVPSTIDALEATYTDHKK